MTLDTRATSASPNSPFRAVRASESIHHEHLRHRFDTARRLALYPEPKSTPIHRAIAAGTLLLPPIFPIPWPFRTFKQHQMTWRATATITTTAAATVSLLIWTSKLREALAIPNFVPPPHIEATLPPDWRRGIVACGPVTDPFLRSRKAYLETEPTVLEACLITAGIETTTASLNGTEVFWDTAQSDNLHFHYHPHAVIFPKSTEQVGKALKCVSTQGHGVAVAARSGGHSFGGYGSGGQDGSLVIDLKYLDHVRLRTDGDHLAEVGPATRLGDVVKGLWKNGHKRGMPHGTCPVVGTGGHALCGGFGPTSRKWGMTTDALVEAKVVLVNGTVVTASRNSNPELLWGLKGAGANFGIVTNLVFETQPVESPMMFIEYRWSPSMVSGADIAKVFVAIQSFATTGSDLPEEFGFHVQINPATQSDPKGGVMALHMRGIYMGSNATYQSTVAPKLWSHFKSLGASPPDMIEEKEMTYYHLMEEWDDFGNAGNKLNTVSERQIRNNFIARTQLTMGQKGFSQSILTKVFQTIYDHARTGYGSEEFAWNIYLEMYGGGASAKHRSREVVAATSFPHRDALWLIQSSVATWGRRDLSPAGFGMIEELEGLFVGAMKMDGLERRSFPCYVDAHLNQAEVRYLYYDDKVLPRLEELKRQLDPYNVLRNPQSIGGKEYLGPSGGPPVTTKSDGIQLSHPLPRELSDEMGTLQAARSIPARFEPRRKPL